MDYLFLGTSGHVSAVDRETGREVWRVSLPSTGYHIVSLLVDRGCVFAASKGYLFCLEAATGKILWNNTMPGLGHRHVYLAAQGAPQGDSALLGAIHQQHVQQSS